MRRFKRRKRYSGIVWEKVQLIKGILNFSYGSAKNADYAKASKLINFYINMKRINAYSWILDTVKK